MIEGQVIYGSGSTSWDSMRSFIGYPRSKKYEPRRDENENR
jgi:hypothetical protein